MSVADPASSGTVMPFLRANWFSIGAVIFASGAYAATLQVVRGEVAAVAAKVEQHADIPPRVTAVEAAQRDVRDDVKAIRADQTRILLGLAAVCQKTEARCP